MDKMRRNINTIRPITNTISLYVYLLYFYSFLSFLNNIRSIAKMYLQEERNSPNFQSAFVSNFEKLFNLFR